MPDTKKQLPLVTAVNKTFWEAARRHELVTLKSGEWVKVSGRGEVFTFCIYRQSFHPAWANDIPYNVAYVKLAEGPLLMTNIVGCDNKDIYIGMPVEVIYEDVTEEVTLPKFKPVK